jgi:hypothetical protein
MSFPSPAELDAQSKIHVDRWIEFESEEWRELDDNPDFTKKIVRLGFQEPAYLFTDLNGRIWGRGEDGRYYPFHFSKGSINIGYRMSKRTLKLQDVDP